MSIGERISDLRKERNISQARLAEFLGISRQAVSKWETDQSSPDTLNLIRLADILDTDVEYLATGRVSQDEKPPVIIKTVEVIEKVTEKPVVRTVEKIVEKIVEQPVVQFVERPVVKKIYRTRYIRSPLEYLIVGGISFAIGLLIGVFFF